MTPNTNNTYPSQLQASEIYGSVVPLQAILDPLTTRLSKEDQDLVTRAYRAAEKAHEGQKRLSGAPYFSHVSRVALELAGLGLDAASLAAGLLHDTVEDTGVRLETLKADFGPEVAELVDGVTKISTRAFRTSEEKQVENLRKMLLAMAKDIRVLLIKLADRLHNIRTIGYLESSKAQRIARETLDLYAPLAHRLGIAKWKWELEDRSMAVLYPDAYREIHEKITSSQGDRLSHLAQAKEMLGPKLAEAGLQAELISRSKHTWSIYQKMLQSNKSFEEVFDLMGLRVITRDVHDCYAAMGIIHSIWKPLPGRVKDYIAMPKSNMYQSLHTTVIGPQGLPLEVQVRTQEMHKTAEMGVAAHWYYKEGSKSGTRVDPSFFSALSEWQNELKDSREFMEFLKIDLYEAEVFVFTPRGEVKRLPRGSNPIDFAFAVHSSVGEHTYGAKVNGKMVPLRHELRSGDIVEVLTSPSHEPSKDWLHYVKSSKAKNRIHHYFKERDQKEYEGRGRELLEKECEAENFQLHDFFKSPQLLEAARHHSLASIEDLLAAVGIRQISPKHVVAWLKEQSAPSAGPGQAPAVPLPVPVKVQPARPISISQGVQVKGLSGMLVTFARCCAPVHGDPILGFVTVGRGVSIHRTDCVNAADLARKTERLVEVAWAGAVQPDEARPVQIIVSSYDRPGLMAEMLMAIAETKSVGQSKTNISAASARSLEDGMAEGAFTVAIADVEHLKRVMLSLHQVKGVTSVKRKSDVKR
jgi:GTP pyrophosphokinase